MADQNLFLPICGPLLFALILVVAIFGMRARLEFARRLRMAYKDKSKINPWIQAHRTKHRVLSLLCLLSILGIFFLGGLILSGVLQVSTLILIVFGSFILLGIVCGTLLLLDLEKLAKR